MIWARLAVAAVAAACAAAKQTPFVLKDENMFTTLKHPAFPAHSLRVRRPPPHLCERKDNTLSWSGYLDVDVDKLLEEKDANLLSHEMHALRGQGVMEHFYFWAFESRSQPETDPVTLWLNGGPGCSSFTGLLMELGPCNAAKPDPNPHTDYNKYSWTSNSSMVFLDQPVGVGFSYASWKNTSRTDSPPSRIFDTPAAARDVSAFLHLLHLHQKQAIKGPKLGKRKFHMAGESYAGRYLPLIASKVLEDNEHFAKHPEHGLQPLPLESVLIGNGITSPIRQNKAYIDYACTNKSGHAPFLDDVTCERMRVKWPICKKLVEKCNAKSGNVPYNRIHCQSAASFCSGALSSPWDKTNSSVYDWKHAPEYEQEAWVSAFLNHPATRKALGVDGTGPGDKHDGKFIGCSDKVYNDFELTGDGARDSTWAVEDILSKGVRVLSYSGKRDFICNFIGNARWIEDLQWSGSDGYKSAPLEPWFVEGRTVPAGHFRTYGNLTYATVENAGHFVPLDQPISALTMMRRWEHGRIKGRLD